MSSDSDIDHFHHVRDAIGFDLPRGLTDEHGHGALDVLLPNILGFQITKFMVLQVVAAVIVWFIFRGLAKRAAGGEPVRGRFWNFWEAIALFIRDEVVRPTIGDHHHNHGDEYDFHGEGTHGHGTSHDHHRSFSYSHPADQYLPFIWSCFFYILICNLLGAIPFLGSATGNLNVTGVLAVSAFVATVMYGFQAMGPSGFFKNMMPATGVPGAFGSALTYGIFAIEVFGFFIKHSVLAVRLFANIMGGHTVLAVILGFIAQAAHGNMALWGLVTFGSVVGQVFIGCLELFVAFLQAYVFAFLATIFIAGAVHEH
ncbi:MAG: F0F1 ATP synthase subunit A [Planctomycetaceae bacterium]|nr:F0F1 ATP synthase subunit A [Planctomycetaceae bacterium]